ncbi:MAG: hypothetical protein ACAH59_03510 [Pseudobdellovibrionaceae bacterium]
MKTFFFIFIAIHFLAFQFARGQDLSPAIQVSSPEKKDDCKDLLPQMENEHLELQAKYKSLKDGSLSAHDGYLVSFNEMTKVLFQLTQAKVEETQKITTSRDQLSEALRQYQSQANPETSKKVQDQYLDLTVRLYTAAVDAQKTVENLKAQISQVEATRGQYQSSQTEIDQIDQQLLATEAKLVSLKIKCQTNRRY